MEQLRESHAHDRERVRFSRADSLRLHEDSVLRTAAGVHSGRGAQRPMELVLKYFRFRSAGT